MRGFVLRLLSFHPPLLYGRRGDPLAEDTEGIAVCRVERKSTKTWLYCLITYTYPTLSARAVPDLKIFCDTTRTCPPGLACSNWIVSHLYDWYLQWRIWAEPCILAYLLRT